MTRSKQIAKINLIRSERKNNIFLTYPFPKSQQDILIKIFFLKMKRGMKKSLEHGNTNIIHGDNYNAETC